jgi:hypothetical protein
MTIDEEITSIIKGMDYDYKRLRNILQGFTDKQGDDITKNEYREREKVAEILKKCNSDFQKAFHAQTSRFEINKGNEVQGIDQTNIDLDDQLISAARKLEILEKKEIINAD